MREALVILPSSSITLPPNSSPTPPHHHRSATAKPKPKLKPKRKPIPSPSQLTSQSPLLSTLRWDSSSQSRHSLKYYAELASKLAQDGRFNDSLMIAESVVVSGVNAAEFAALLNAKIVSDGIVRLLEEGKLKSVVELLTGAQKLGIEPLKLFDGAAMNALSRECRRTMECGEIEEVVSLMETLKGCGMPIKDLVKPSEVIRLCISQRKPNTAVRYAHIFPHVDIMFCTVILEFGKKGDLASALTVFEASKQNQDTPNLYVYRTIIDVCGLCGDYLKSRSIYEGLIASKFTPNIYVFNSLMNVNACDLSYTLDIYKQMQKLGVPADLTSYNILLKSCCLATRVDLAKEIYGELKQLEIAGTLKLDVFTYSTLIKVFADAKMWQMALKIKRDMLSAGVIPNIVTWSSLISACANAGLVDQAIQLFEEMLQAGCEPNSQCYNILLHACVEACQYDRAFRLFRSWKEQALQKENCEDLGSNTDNTIDLSPTLMVSGSIPNCTSASPHGHFSKRIPFRPTTSTYNILMKACGSDYYRAKALMEEMKKVGLSPNHISWSILIDICGGSGNVEGALQILRSMREAGIQPDVVTFTTIIKVCVETKDFKSAFSLFAAMKRYQIKPNMVTYNTLLRARSRYGSLQEVQQCLAIYQDMRKAGYKPNDYYLKQLIEQWCEGVIQNGNQRKGYFSSRNRSGLEPESMILEKVAEHLQKDNANSVSINLRGLSKVEARIVVLAVLRMIREKYTAGDSIKDDVQIFLGVQEVGIRAVRQESVVKEAVIKLLQHDLGLDVISATSRIGNDRNQDGVNHLEKCSNMEEHAERGILRANMHSPTRRPAVLQKLRIPKESLQSWLTRRLDASIVQ
ncbi:pentatricopeptide repeat-containing protein At5g02830, chloroplastic [Nicotiana sylvestris]|uniref:Pentatricopeptide repeat-containing protein At5g02830, chloroplastic n=1 Tax=Nicotiana sylvestris TaxID=4096 RepID=A0A1U7WPR9_NICSY|nr:PREDICTED: pentatricopeptide repeat-containing protein At5g02830, chloroplastic [Nicotiana sylvestris]XP_016463308.1 PREDICTED: pentatricopeptide repeat-containing protein At5g02830, chloroplastic-like [Nicotiana tabacum]